MRKNEKVLIMKSQVCRQWGWGEGINSSKILFWVLLYPTKSLPKHDFKYIYCICTKLIFEDLMAKLAHYFINILW